MRLAVPDLVSNSYFPAIAAVELGYLDDVELELVFPVGRAATALRDGDIDFLAGSAHAPLYADPEWGDTRILMSLARNMYWFLVVRPDLDVTRTTLSTLREIRIGAAPGPDLGLRRLLRSEGVDIDAAGITIAPVPMVDPANVSFGVTAARALRDGVVDAFWANGMGAEVAVRDGIGRVVVDARREGGEPALFTFPALMAAGRTVRERPAATATVVRAVVRAQRELRRDPALATTVGRALFPDLEAGLIAGLIERDADYYEPTVSRDAVTGLAAFARVTGLTSRALDNADIVAGGMAPLWHADEQPGSGR